MFEPQKRSSIYDILRAPNGLRLESLVATTYSASLDTVLSMPAAMLVDGAGGLRQGVGAVTAADLAAIRRVCDRTAIFCQGAAILPAERISPAVIEAEEMVHAVMAPNGGSFHPKVWVIRFTGESVRRSVLRVAIMSRNLTGDKSWDAGMVMEGTAGGTKKPNELGALIRLLPTICLRELDAERTAMVFALADEVENTRWKLPPGLSSLGFHLIGGGPAQSWQQPKSDRLAVVSPFLTAGAIRRLSETTGRLSYILSRSTALAQCWAAVESRFDRIMVLAQPGEVDDGPTPTGLHAKLLLWEKGAKVLAAIGSMNATTAAVSGKNVEFMVTVDCSAAIGESGIDALLEPSSLGAVLEDFAVGPDDAPAPAPFDDRDAKSYLLAANMHLACRISNAGWEVSLVCDKPYPEVSEHLPGLTFRLATMGKTRAGECGPALATGKPARLPGSLDLSEITGFVVFEAIRAEAPIAFILNLEVRGVEQEERRHAALKALLPDARSFSEFLRIMLGEFQSLGSVTDSEGGSGSTTRSGFSRQQGLLEMLVRCAADEPDRLRAIKQTIDAFKPDELNAIAPPEFAALWSALFEITGGST